MFFHWLWSFLLKKKKSCITRRRKGSGRPTSAGRWRGMVMSTLAQMKRWTVCRWIIRECWETLSHRVPAFHLRKVNSTYGKPHTDMKLQPRDTTPRASWPVWAQRGELWGLYTENEPHFGITPAVIRLRFVLLSWLMVIVALLTSKWVCKEIKTFCRMYTLRASFSFKKTYVQV